MQAHAQIGADILSGDDSDLMSMAHDIAISHHEKWNGEGYPNRLKGEEIPLGARLLAVADTFDSMTTDRSYQKAASVETALAELVACTGTQFCPVAVEAFISAFPAKS